MEKDLYGLFSRDAMFDCLAGCPEWSLRYVIHHCLKEVLKSFHCGNIYVGRRDLYVVMGKLSVYCDLGFLSDSQYSSLFRLCLGIEKKYL